MEEVSEIEVIKMEDASKVASTTIPIEAEEDNPEHAPETHALDSAVLPANPDTPETTAAPTHFNDVEVTFHKVRLFHLGGRVSTCISFCCDVILTRAILSWHG